MEQARRALKTGAILREAGEHYWACFTFQQAAEMALKAGLERFGEDHVGHNLLELVASLRMASRDEPPEGVREGARRLNRLYVPTRYPDAVGGSVPADNYSAEDSELACQDAGLILAYIGTLLDRGEPS